jgi:hypothetical protein
VAHLGEGEGGEDHSLPDLRLSLLIPDTDAQRHQRHEHPDPEDVTAQAPGEDRLLGEVGGTAHGTPLGRLRAQG